MKTKKIVIAVLTVTLLIFALLVSSCIEQLDVISGNDVGDNNQVTPGRGIVEFIISDGSARTILPNASIADMYFRVTFVDKAPTGAGPDQVFPKGTTVGNSGAAIKLTSGKFYCKVLDGQYDVSIQAFSSDTADPTNLITAWGTNSPSYPSGGYTVNSTHTTISASLSGKMTTTTGSEGKGVFKYNVTIPSAPSSGTNTTTGFTGYTAQTLDVYKYGTLTTAIPQVDLSGSANNTSGSGIQINSGVYQVKITLKAGNCEDRVLTNVMHIWDGLTSTYTEENLPAPNQNKFTVKFNKNGGLTGDSDSSPITSGGTVSKPVADPTHSTDIFDDWYTAATGGTLWNFASNKVYRDDIILYAQYTTAPGTNMEITISFDDTIGDEHAQFVTGAVVMNNGTSTVGSITYDTLADVNKSAYITITLTSDLVGVGNLGRWTVKVNGVDTDISSSVAFTGGNAVLTISKTNVAAILGSGVAGNYIIGVEIDDGSVGALPYSANITINVNRQ